MSRKFEVIYGSLPVWIQETLISLFSIKRNFVSRYNRHYREAMRATQLWEFSEDSTSLQQLKLDEIVEYASKHVPWYKEKSVYQSKDLRLFPVISKSDVREHHEDFITRHWWHKWNSTKVSTSGSTGTSVQYLISSLCTATERADVNSYRNRLGYQRGDKIASFIGRKIADLSQKKPPFWRHNHIDNQLIFSYWHLSDKTLPLYVEKLKQFKPKFLHGYPSFLMQIAIYSLDNELDWQGIKGVFTSSENLLPHQRRAIQDAFSTVVIDRYSSAETIGAVSQCEHGSYHENPYFGLLEIIDGQIVFSTLHNKTMPLIRFNTGDLGKWSEKKNCPCGRTSRMISEIDGRLEDMVVSADGRRFGRLDHLFKDVPGLIEAQIIQESHSALTILAVSRLETTTLEAKINEAVHAKLGSTFEVTVKFVERIPRTKAGKLRFVVSKISA